MIESTDFTHSSRKAWKTINKLTKDYTEPQQQCKVTADQVAHQLLLNGKGNKLHVPRREKMPRQTVTESKLTSPFFFGKDDLFKSTKNYIYIYRIVEEKDIRKYNIDRERRRRKKKVHGSQ